MKKRHHKLLKRVGPDGKKANPIMKFIGGKAEKKLKCEPVRDREFYPYYLLQDLQR